MAEAAIIHNRKMKSRETTLNILLWILIGILFLFLAGELIVQFFIIPNFTIKHVNVQSDFPVSKDAVLKLAGINNKLYYFEVKPNVIAARIEEYPLVKRAAVKKVFPDTLSIVITGRKPLAVALVNTEEKSVPVLLDEDGVIFHIGGAGRELNLPVISGLSFKDFRIGTILPKKVKPFLTDLYRLKEDYPNLFKIISEIRIIPKSSTDYELVFCPVSYNVKVRLGKRLEAKTVKYALMVLDLLKDDIKSRGIDELDFREGNMVYKVREE